MLCVVPMKPLADAKQRLAAVLAPQERRGLTLAMLTDVVRACAPVATTWVLNSDDDAADAARDAGGVPRPDPTPGRGLNASLNAATAEAVDAGHDAVLVISADLPALTSADVAAMRLGDGMALAPNRYGTGTNALWRRPADLVPVFFGPNSRRAHEGLSFAHGFACAIVTRSALALDVDAPRDLLDIIALGPGEATRTVLAELGYPRRGR